MATNNIEAPTWIQKCALWAYSLKIQRITLHYITTLVFYLSSQANNHIHFFSGSPVYIIRHDIIKEVTASILIYE